MILRLHSAQLPCLVALDIAWKKVVPGAHAAQLGRTVEQRDGYDRRPMGGLCPSDAGTLRRPAAPTLSGKLVALTYPAAGVDLNPAPVPVPPDLQFAISAARADLASKGRSEFLAARRIELLRCDQEQDAEAYGAEP